jgi:DNA-directed RNA polymerase II subunit RPB1
MFIILKRVYKKNYKIKMPVDISSLQGKLKGKPKRKEGGKKKPERSKEKVQGKREAIEVKAQNDIDDAELPDLVLDSVSYATMTREKMEKISVCKVTKVLPKGKITDTDFTTDDHRLGSLENNSLCSACGKTNDECPGHYGMIDLPKKYIHPLFREPAIRVCQSICWRCFKPLHHKDFLNNVHLSGYQKLMYIAKESVDIEHPQGSCKKHQQSTYPYYKNPIFKTGTGPRTVKGKVVGTPSAGAKDSVDIFAQVKTGTSRDASKFTDYVITPEMVYNMFSNLSDSDVRSLGFDGKFKDGNWVWNNHPINFIVDFIPVIPPSARPYVKREGIRKDDFITKFYDDVIIETQKYYNSEEGRENYLSKILFYYSHIIDNGDKAYKKAALDVIKSFKDRLVGKTELIRGSLMGKRSDFTGRTVLGPNGGLEFGEIAPPAIMKSTLTIPEHVTKYNIDFIKKLSADDEIRCLIPKRGKLAGRKLKFKKDKHEIKIGDIVERNSRDGDSIIFNRAPTLQKQSMCGYKCKFQNKLSIGLHITSTTGHNADFDGDEGNIHMLQSAQAQAEAKTFVSSPYCIMSGINSSPVGGIIYNGATGAYLLSDDSVILTDDEFQEGLRSMRYAQEHHDTYIDRLFELNIEHGQKLNPKSGKSLCSLLFPKDFWYSNGKVKIRKGILMSGRLTKKNMGPSPNSIVQSIYKNYGVETTRRFITDATFLFNWYLSIYGFTVGVKDCRPPENLEEEFNLRKRQIIKEINDEVLSFPPLARDATELDKSQREQKIQEVITTGTDRIKMALVGGEVTEDGKKIKIERILAPDNSISIMASSGAKGKINDTAKIIALLGQQYVPDRRPDLVMSRGKRWLSSFHVDDKSIFSRGFVSNSFYEGLDPDEFFAHSMASRIGLCNTAVKTADIGFLQRKMVKSQEDLVAQYDGSVRNQTGNIFQFSYGAGFGSSKMIRRTRKDGTDYLTFINLEETVGKINADSGYINENFVFDEVKDLFS